MKEPEKYIKEVKQWASSCVTVQALALIGSHARNEAKPDSDIDFLIICDDKSKLIDDIAWVNKFGEVISCTKEEWGIVTSIRVSYRDGQEIEFGLAPLNWVDITFGDKIPEGISDRIKILIDDNNILGKLKKAV